MNIYKNLKCFNVFLIICLVSACAYAQDTNLTYKNKQSVTQACPKPKFKFVSEYGLENFNGCRDTETFSFSDGMHFECKETIEVENYRGLVALFEKFDDKLKCGTLGEVIRERMIKDCKTQKDKFELKITQGHWKRFDSFAMPVKFIGGVRFYSLEHRIVLDSVDDVSYRVFLENDRYLPFTQCEMEDAKGKQFWFDIL
jgi:hypothetical protein